jgi:hypothetical protein
MNDARKKMTPRFAKRAAQMNALCKRLGLKPLDEARVQSAYERRVERRGTEDYAGCMSVTATAQALGVRRSALFEWLDREGWMHRTDGSGWHAMHHALSNGWVVMRGPASIAWPQITSDGRAEIARHFGVCPDADSAT